MRPIDRDQSVEEAALERPPSIGHLLLVRAVLRRIPDPNDRVVWIKRYLPRTAHLLGVDPLS